MFKQILVVCTGNICRSPVAAAMLQQRLPGYRVNSAGLGALVGHGVDSHARRLAETDGLSVADHTARQLDSALIRDADLILVMSEGQRREIAKFWPEALGKTLRLGQWLDGGRGMDIPDPYRKSDEVFVRVHRCLREATDSWVAKL